MGVGFEVLDRSGDFSLTYCCISALGVGGAPQFLDRRCFREICDFAEVAVHLSVCAVWLVGYAAETSHVGALAPCLGYKIGLACAALIEGPGGAICWPFTLKFPFQGHAVVAGYRYNNCRYSRNGLSAERVVAWRNNEEKVRADG